MPRFFIDLHDGANFVKDKVGFDLPDEQAVRERLARIMARAAQNLAGAPERQDVFAIVRDENRQIVLRAHLSFDIETVERG
ncbi:DUF6894 family protein [Methylobacterium organophilum]|uniref:DUF6894 domain-containing protein n=1 Tax=Methylobacterium organophilum TaxID=410 RepID=A0ABQ4T7D6_METOR|nr:hypothetical protein [Methylobacterium organophilum]UMY16440.1 hypothetical protein MMB17_17260 [Methylobacterium organophilum]GJE27158.1 hypothetical protein LKMONMHP_2014 [Methylobacterium organophilum]